MYHGDTLNIRLPEYLGKLLPVSPNIVQLGAAKYNCPAFNKILMEARIGERNAISSQEQVNLVQERSIGRDKGKLHWPMSKH